MLSGSTCTILAHPPDSYNISGLTQGTVYYIRVSALNSLGYGQPSDYQDAMPMTSSDAPGIPTTITQLAPGESGAGEMGYASFFSRPSLNPIRWLYFFDVYHVLRAVPRIKWDSGFLVLL